jgi:hypothetical protein
LSVVDISYVVMLYNTGDDLPLMLQSFAALRLDDVRVDGIGVGAATMLQFILDSTSAQLLVLSSHSYDADGYITDCGEFQTLAQLNPCNLTPPAKQ